MSTSFIYTWNSGEFRTSSEAEQERTENEDDEYERIFSRLAELEKEEEAAESDDENELSDYDFDHSINQLSIVQEVGDSRVMFYVYFNPLIWPFELQNFLPFYFLKMACNIMETASNSTCL